MTKKLVPTGPVDSGAALQNEAVTPEVVPATEGQGQALSLDPAAVATRKSHRSLPERAEKVANGDPLAQLLTMAMDGGGSKLQAETLERLVSLAEHVADRRAKLAYGEAFVKLQARLTPVTPTSTSTFGPYATLGDILSAVRKPLADEGFSLAFGLNQRWVPQQNDVELTLLTTLTHIGGHSESSEVSIVVEVGPVSSRTGQAVRSVAQARAAALTATRRLAVLSMLNLTTGEPEQETATEAAAEQAPEGVAEAVAQLQAVTSRAQLLETWAKVPFAIRTYIGRTRPEVLADLKTKYPEAPKEATA